VAGVGADNVGVIWLDAHSDLETPETTPSGFYDGQALSTLTGRCWRQITETAPHFSPVPPDGVIVVGGREASDAEKHALESFDWIREDAMGSNAELDRLVGRVRKSLSPHRSRRARPRAARAPFCRSSGSPYHGSAPNARCSV
jgi:arginase